MPDHEEAVREARLDVLDEMEVWAWKQTSENHAELLRELSAFESAIRASERAKYAALVEAAGIRCGGMHQTTLTTEVAEWCGDPICAAVRVLQSKEGTNE